MQARVSVAMVFLILCAWSAGASTITVSGLSGAPRKINTVENSEGLFISLTGLSECFSASCVFSAEKRKLVINLNYADLIFTETNPFVLAGDSVINLMQPPFMENGDFFAPAVPVLEIFDRVLPEKILLSSDKKSIQVIRAETVPLIPAPAPVKAQPAPAAAVQEKPQPPSQAGMITRGAYEERKNGALYTLYLPDSLSFDFTFFKPQLNVNIFKGKISASDINQKMNSGLVREIEAVQFADNAQVAFMLSDKMQQPPEVTYHSGPPRLEVVLRADAAPAKPRLSKITTVIIDPGHGGKDPGAISAKPRLEEKAAVLGICKRLSGLMKEKAPEIKCLMTRDDDTFIGLKERSHLANQNKGSLFVSVHANSVKGKKSNVSGYTVYFLDAARDDEARAAAALENAALEYEDTRQEETGSDLDFILKSTELNLYRNESEDFAILLEQEMGKEVKGVKRNKTGVSQAGFYVLRFPQMPAVLVETAFISNPHEAELLGKEGFQEEVAQAVCTSILRFKEKYEKAMNGQ